MSESKTTNNDISLQSFHDIMFKDAMDRGSIWGDLAEEFLRLGMLAQCMRGSPLISVFAGKAACACHDIMKSEAQHAKKQVNAMEKVMKSQAELDTLS